MAHIPASVLMAVRAGDLTVVNSWLMNGGDEFVNETDGNDKLITLAIEGDRDRPWMGDDSDASAMVELLLQAGASPEVLFLMQAIGARNVEVALVLVARGADVAARYGAWTPLHFAAKMGAISYARESRRGRAMARHAELIRAMLDAGAPVDARDESVPTRSDFDNTPLMYAAGCGYTSLDVLKLLLKYGADVDAVASDGRTAEDYARAALNLPIDPHQDGLRRGPGVVEGALALFRDYRAAGGTWKRYVAEPRKQLLVLRRLVERGRAAPPDGTLARVQGLPDVLFWKVLKFWRSDRDRLQCRRRWAELRGPAAPPSKKLDSASEKLSLCEALKASGATDESDVTWTSLGWDVPGAATACALSTWKRLKKAHGGGDDADFQEALDAVTSELQAEVDGGAD